MNVMYIPYEDMYQQLWNKLLQHLNVYVIDGEQNHKDHYCS